MNRNISSASQLALTGDGSSKWFSILVSTDRFSTTNENGTFAFGTGPLSSNDVDKVLPTIPGGSGFGLNIDGNTPGGSPFYIYAYSIDGGTATRSTGFFNTGTTPATFMIAGRFDWAASGTNDVLTLFNITDAASPSLPAPFATVEADLDQSLFDTLAITNRQVSSVDEIRFGDTAADVGAVAVPEPASLGLMLSATVFCAAIRYRRLNAAG